MCSNFERSATQQKTMRTAVTQLEQLCVQGEEMEEKERLSNGKVNQKKK